MDHASGMTLGQSAKTPLGLLGLFVALVYAVGSLSFAVQSEVSDAQRWVLVGFVVLFPLILLGCFMFLITRNYGRMFSPSEFRTDEAFLHFTQGFQTITEVEVEPFSEVPDSKGAAPVVSQQIELRFEPEELSALMLGVHLQQKGLFLGHVVRPRQEDRWRIAVFVTGWGYLDLVERAEFFWSGQRGLVQALPDAEGKVGIVINASDGFLIFARVHLVGGSSVLLSHYCNLEFGEGEHRLRQQFRRLLQTS